MSSRGKVINSEESTETRRDFSMTEVSGALSIENLSVQFATEDRVIEVVTEVSFDVMPGRTLALLGESGCGKTVTALSILRLIDPPGRVTQGKILYRSYNAPTAHPIDILELNPDGQQIRSIRGNEIAMIFQEPMSSFTPVYTIGEQISEAIVLHRNVSRREARQISIDLLAQVGIPAPERRFDEYPHELSGGMCQRAMIAMAISCRPGLLIADEPTTALDVTIQAQVLQLLKQIQENHGTSILLITHDLGVVADMADDVAVMYLGRIVEKGSAEQIFDAHRHPYTQGLFNSVPDPFCERQAPLASIPGTVPDYAQAPSGCPFRSRCPEEMYVCRFEPRLVEIEQGHEVSCWLYCEAEPDELEIVNETAL